MRIWNHFDSGFRDKHPGSATLLVLVFLAFDRLTFVFLWGQKNSSMIIVGEISNYSKIVFALVQQCCGSGFVLDANPCGSGCESVCSDADPDPQ
jgi:hypothetical protein